MIWETRLIMLGFVILVAALILCIWTIATS